MLKNVIDTLSGNVPGGIGFYFVLLISVYLSLRFIYRVNEFFTRRHFQGWFLVLWLIFSGVYLYLWLKNPPSTLLKRYSVIFYSEQPQNRWLAYYFRDELSESIKPFKSRQNYFFPQRWFYLADFPDSLNNGRFLRKLIRKIPLRRVLLGEVISDKENFKLRLEIIDNSGNKTKQLTPVRFSGRDVSAALGSLLDASRAFLPVRARSVNPLTADSNFVMMRDEFYRARYLRAQKYLKRIEKKWPKQPFVRRWRAFIQIRLAESLRSGQTRRNPFEFRKAEWQRMVESARSDLIRMMRADITVSQKDVMLNMMLGESYMLTESYGKAEIFLKNAFIENPFSISTLENLSRLHTSRIQALKFDDDAAVQEKILDYAPLYLKILKSFVIRMLRRGPVGSLPFQKAKASIDHFLMMNPESVNGWLLLGKYWEQITRDDMALKTYLKIDSLSPRNPTNKYNLGVSYFRLRDYPAAERYFQEAVRLDDFLNAHLYLGAIYQQTGQYKKALKEFRYRVAHQKGPNDFYALQAMKGIRECLKQLNIPVPEQKK